MKNLQHQNYFQIFSKVEAKIYSWLYKERTPEKQMIPNRILVNYFDEEKTKIWSSLYDQKTHEKWIIPRNILFIYIDCWKQTCRVDYVMYQSMINDSFLAQRSFSNILTISELLFRVAYKIDEQTRNE